MRFTPSTLPDVILIEPDLFRDDRGYFFETFQARKFADAGIPATLVQENVSRSRQNVLRGLHYQIRQPQGKLVRVTSGRIFDVAVDLRRASPTFGRWEGVELTAEDCRQLWIPPGFAHGFLALSAWADVCYSVTDFYNRDAERTLIWNDPTVGICWPLPAGVTPILSAKDVQGVLLADAEVY
jgi:dTDP-4-dehydrorhamnose 3,5-epimerase